MSRIRHSLAVLAAVLLAACASTGQAGGAAADDGPATATVVVNNNLTIPAPLSVYLVPEAGVRRLLGNVSPGEASPMAVTGALAPGRYRLLARTNGGADRVSDPFALSEGERVTWNLQSNIVSVTRP